MSTLGQEGGGGSVRKLATGIDGFDTVTLGGLPEGRATVLAGQAGSAKTVFAAQFLGEGVRLGQPGVFVTLEEPASALRANLATLGLDVERWEAEGLWRFVDASPVIRSEGGVAPYDLELVSAMVGRAVDETGARRLALDSLNSVLSLHSDPGQVRQDLRRLIADLRGMGLTVLLTVETPGDPGGALSRYGIEEFVADNVVLLRNVREGSFRRRTVEVLKMRGAAHRKGDVGFTVVPGRGVVVLPVLPPRAAEGPEDRVTTGNEGLDGLLRGGLLRGSSALYSGPTGTGKTLLATQFALEGAARGDRVLLMAYEESPDQVRRNAAVLGHDAAAYERDGLLQVVSTYPEVASLDDHLVELRDRVAALQPARLVIDSLSALERVGSVAAYREFVIGVTSFVRTVGLASVLTASSSQLVGATSVTESHISGLIDTIVLLRHVETASALQRAVLVLKARGLDHEHEIRELLLDQGRPVVGERFSGARGLLSGQPLGG